MNKKLIGGITAGVVALAVIAAVLISGVLGGNDDKPSNTPVDNPGQSSSEVIEQEKAQEIAGTKDNMTIENINTAVEKLSDDFTFTEETEENLFVVDGLYRVSTSTVYKGKANTSDDEVELAISHRINGNPSIAMVISSYSLSEADVYKLAEEVLTDITSKEVIKAIIDAEYDKPTILDIVDDGEESDLLIEKTKLDGLNEGAVDYIFGATYTVHSEDLKETYEHNPADMMAYRAIPVFSYDDNTHILNENMYIVLTYALDGNWGKLVDYSFKQSGNIQSNSLSYEITMESGEKTTQSFETILDTESMLVNYTANLMTGYYNTMEEVVKQAVAATNIVCNMNYTVENYTEMEKTDKFATYSMIDLDNELSVVINVSYEDSIGYYGTIAIS